MTEEPTLADVITEQLDAHDRLLAEIRYYTTEVPSDHPLTDREFRDALWLMCHRTCMKLVIGGRIEECVSCGQLRP